MERLEKYCDFGYKMQAEMKAKQKEIEDADNDLYVLRWQLRLEGDKKKVQKLKPGAEQFLSELGANKQACTNLLNQIRSVFVKYKVLDGKMYGKEAVRSTAIKEAEENETVKQLPVPKQKPSRAKVRRGF